MPIYRVINIGRLVSKLSFSLFYFIFLTFLKSFIFFEYCDMSHIHLTESIFHWFYFFSLFFSYTPKKCSRYLLLMQLNTFVSYIIIDPSAVLSSMWAVVQAVCVSHCENAKFNFSLLSYYDAVQFVGILKI